MHASDYVVIGASHAALSAVHALRMHDPDGSVAMVTRDATLPYSPTILPYVVSGVSDPDRVFLRDEAYFRRANVAYLTGATVARVAADRKAVCFADGAELAYGKLLIASGATPILPPIPGLEGVRFHVLRTLGDALALRAAAAGARSALVMGAGLVGMHAAENLATAGLAVTVVERQSHVLPGYFDARAAAIIASCFRDRGVRLVTDREVTEVAPAPGGCRVTLDDGEAIAADLLVVAVGVAPAIAFLADSGIRSDRGVLVDETMRSSHEDVWAAGDVAQAASFYDATKILNGILPDAVEQGRIAGMAMAGDPAVRPYLGAVPLNTYAFFGQQAVSVGIHGSGLRDVEVVESVDAAHARYLKIVLSDDRLLGIFGINVALDPGVLWELVRRRVDLGPVRERFVANPRDTARVLMSQQWR